MTLEQTDKIITDLRQQIPPLKKKLRPKDKQWQT